MAKHTPGPWMVDRDGDIARAADGRLLACPNWPFENETPDDDEVRANANLIAEAPAMLEALVQGRKLLSYIYGAGDPNISPTAVIAQIEAVIAKARGEAA